MKTAAGERPARSVELPDDDLRHRAERRGDAPGRHRAARGRSAPARTAPRPAPRSRAAARSRGARRAPAGPARVRSASPHGAAAAWRTARSRATTRSARPRRWCASRCVRRCRTARPRRRCSSSTTGASTEPEDEGRASQLLETLGLRTKGERDARVLLVLVRNEEEVWKSFRNLGERVQIILPEELNAYDMLVNDWLVFSQATLDATVVRAAHRTATGAKPSERRRPTDAGDQSDPTPRHDHPAGRVGEVVRRLRRERLHVHRRARRQQDRDPQGGRGALRHEGHERQHASTARASASATAARARGATAPTRSAPSSPSPPARIASRSSGADGAHSQAQAHEPGPPVPVVLRLRGGHQGPSGEVADQAEAAHRRPQLLRPDDVASPRWRSQAAVPRRRLQAEQGRRAREGRRDRVRPEPQRAHRAAALPRRREALHPRPAGSAGRRHAAERPGLGDPRPATRCRCATSRSAPPCTTSS